MEWGIPSAFLCDAKSASADFLIRATTRKDGGCTAAVYAAAAAKLFI